MVVAEDLQQCAAPISGSLLCFARTFSAVANIGDLPRAPGSRPGARKNQGRLAEAFQQTTCHWTVLLDLEIDLRAFNEVRHASTLDGGYMDENVLAAIVGLNEAEALVAVEPRNGSSCHRCIPLKVCNVFRSVMNPDLGHFDPGTSGKGHSGT